ncbi:MAG: quinolinate synthase NadA [Anaerolineae bacterium]
MKSRISSDRETLLRAAAPLIELALAEDIGTGDVTSEAVLDTESEVHGHIIAKASGVIAGLPVAEMVFRRVAPTIRFIARVEDGEEVTGGTLIAEVSGPARAVLAAERTALNFLQRMSGVATLTRCFVDAVACTAATILDTRKTIPGWRILDKYAVRMGGGVNHRMGLYDMILIKDNHVEAARGIRPAIERARAAHPHLPIEVEVRNLEELQEALTVAPPVNRILLDNMSLAEMRQAVLITAGRVPLEASGGITLGRAIEIAETGVDYISVGALTHSAAALDISMELADVEHLPLRHELIARIAEIKNRLGKNLLILAHHYQRDEIVACADFIGDSLELARQAARSEAEVIVFCGVHFMAETAAILAHSGQHVLMPDPGAGCYLANAATLDAVQSAWERLVEVFGDAERVFTPITYVNSFAALKAFCGRHGGLVCTSSNAAHVMRAALEQRERIFFFPDQHLGRNTARRMGIASEEILLWTKSHPPSPEAIRKAKVVLWPGACNVHQRFRPQDILAMRQRFSDVRILVHPECKQEVVELADDAGSTRYIIEQVQAAPSGTRWAIGTEARLVQRLQRQHPDQHIMLLAKAPPFCRTMGQTTLEKLFQLLEALERGERLNPITVDGETAHWARIALERMLAL